ncbi:MAG: hypothetical protein IH969_04065 [Candidatus Krumholzibacteriota bacterium]|nr:hypothetical protein [Candidatus Krumholzibacteriota bacterium]
MTTRTLRRRRLCLIAIAGLLLPSAVAGDTLRLTDGTVLHGQVRGYAADSLSFRTSFGSDIRVARDRIVSIEFTDSTGAPQGPGLAVPVAGVAADAGGGGVGSIAVTFKEKTISSKIIVTRGNDEVAHLRANWILELLIVDGDTAFAYVDSIMEKTIYKGPDRVYKNMIELKDMYVELPAGPHHVTLVVRNAGLEDYANAFDGAPINMEFVIGDVQVYANRESRVHVGMDRGKLRTKKPRFYRVE